MSSYLEDGPELSAPVQVNLTADLSVAEVLLVNGQLEVVARGLGQIVEQVTPGVYTARVRLGDALRDERVIVRPGKSLTKTLTMPQLASAIPISGSATSHESHQDAARQAGQAVTEALEPTADAEIFLLLREWTREGKGGRDRGPLAAQLTLCSAAGEPLRVYDTGDVSTQGGDRVLSRALKVPAGFYRLRSVATDGAMLELPLYALPGWQTQVFLLSKPCRGGSLSPDFAKASILWSESGSAFEPYRPDLKLLEAARIALESSRGGVSTATLEDSLTQKFQNPMLGLLSAHALVRRRAISKDLLETVVKNLERLIGLLPDVLALKLELDPNLELPVIDRVPMLRRSWSVLLEHSVVQPSLMARGSLPERVGTLVTGRSAWMVWCGESAAAAIAQSPNARGQSGATSDEVRETWRRVRHDLDRTVSRRRGDKSRALRRVVRLLGVPRGAFDEESSDPSLSLAAAPYSPQSEAVPFLQRTTGDTMERNKKDANNRLFLDRLIARRPQDRAKYEARLAQVPAGPQTSLEAVADLGGPPASMVLETIVSEERPVLFVKNGKFDTEDVALRGDEAIDLVERMKNASPTLLPLLPLVGRIDVTNFPNAEFVGTGWFVDNDIVVTNRHVASLVARWDGRQFAFRRGIAGRVIESSLSNAHEYDDAAPDSDRVFKVKEVLYIEPELGAHDIAFLRVERRTNGNAPGFVPIATTDVAAEVPVCVIGYPARAPRRIIPDQALMQDLYRGRFDVKRAAPGFTMDSESGSSRHDCTTLGGNSGSLVVDLSTGRAVGLHFSGLYQEANYAVRASTLNEYVRGKRWNRPVEIESASPAKGLPLPVAAATQSAVVTVPAGSGAVTVTVPLTITIGLGAPFAGDGAAVAVPAVAAATVQPLTPAQVEEAVKAFWRERPKDVVGARVGYFEDGDRIGDQACIAASVLPSRLAATEAAGPHAFLGVPVRYVPAEVSEQLDALAVTEAIDSIAYDDDARTFANFAFTPVNEPMEVQLHVGPEYSWDVLHEFLDGAQGRMVSAMYEFHAPHVKDAIEARLEAGAELTLVLDNATFSKLKGTADEFDRVEVFDDWTQRFDTNFKRVVAPEGKTGLIANSYHIKVTVRDDDKFWLSSGNWKMGSSQPLITPDELDQARAGQADLHGNREWHVVIKNSTLATRFRSHILQDYQRSLDLGGGPVSKSLMEEETFVDVPLEEAMVLERRPPSRILDPLKISDSIKVQPLLTPDQEGAVYSEAVLKLIRSAKRSLLFQIPYIGMPSNPQFDRGYIDELIRALTDKLKSLDDARIILRSGGSKYSSPTHAAWYFKSKGVDIKTCLRVMEDHHTKGMIVDGKRVLIGSHNWSAPGVTLNRDASLLFDDERVAGYFGEAFEIDWERSSELKPKRFVKTESAVLEAVGSGPPPGYMRVPLSDWLKDD